MEPGVPCVHGEMGGSICNKGSDGVGDVGRRMSGSTTGGGDVDAGGEGTTRVANGDTEVDWAETELPASTPEIMDVGCACPVLDTELSSLGRSYTVSKA